MGQKNKFFFVFFIIIIAGLLHSCKVTRYVPENEYLLNSVHIEVDDKDISEGDLEGYVQQKPNKRFLYFFRFHLWVYNTFKPRSKEHGLFHKIATIIGEEPVIYDRFLAGKTIRQLEQYLNNRGYYKATVFDSVKTVGNKLDLYYKLDINQPYVVNSIKYEFLDNSIAHLVLSDTVNSFIKKNIPFDVDYFQKERNRITRQMLESGYYFFRKDFVNFEADSTQNPNKVNVVVRIDDFVRKMDNGTVLRENHRKCYIKDIKLYPSYDPKSAISNSKSYFKTLDTINYEDYEIIVDNLQIKPDVIVRANTLREGQRYDVRDVEATRQFLRKLTFFKLIHIHFEPISEVSDTAIWLNAHFQLTPYTLQGYTVELEGSNAGQNWETGTSVTYQHRNVFRGAELLEVRVKGAVEATRDVVGEDISKKFKFNTYEYGTDFKLQIPKFLMPFQKRQFFRRFRPKTTIAFQYNFQQRPDYTRTLLRGSFWYVWKTSPKMQHVFTPIELNSVHLPKADSSFLAEIRNNNYLRNSYDNFFITASSYQMIYSNQNINTNQDYFYIRTNIEFSGNIINAFNKTLGGKKIDGSYQFFNSRYSQYIKSDLDFRFYKVINKKNKLVTRSYIGVGVPYGNANSLPFIKQYFGGGANGVRAWRSRDLGPGTYRDSSNYPNQTAGLKLEMNVEYRFHIFWVVEGAFFADLGNIWSISNSDNRNGAQFKINQFYKQMALGSGLGIRLDLSFFIFRLDAGLKFIDPSIEGRNKWVLHDRRWKRNDYQVYFCIGYPF